jgi:hypothetical protein
LRDFATLVALNQKTPLFSYQKVNARLVGPRDLHTSRSGGMQ